MSLRDRQRTLARNAILDACAALVTERHHIDFAMKEVAERAGVSLRTVYNHFATREDLLDALGERFDQEGFDLGMISTDDLATIDDLYRAIDVNTQVFEKLGGVSEALAQMPLAEVGRNEGRRQRTELIASFVADEMDAPADQARAVGLVLRHLISHRSWFWLTREYGLTAEQFADITAWLVRIAIDATERGDLPFPEEAGT